MPHSLQNSSKRFSLIFCLFFKLKFKYLKLDVSLAIGIVVDLRWRSLLVTIRRDWRMNPSTELVLSLVCVRTSEILGTVRVELYGKTRKCRTITAPLQLKELGRLHFMPVFSWLPWRGVSLPLNESASVSDVRCGGGSRASGQLSMVGLVQFLLFTLWFCFLFFMIQIKLCFKLEIVCYYF